MDVKQLYISLTCHLAYIYIAGILISKEEEDQ